MSEQGTTRGYLTLAAGSARFLEMGVDMALSLREHTTHPIAIAVDEPIAELVERRYPTVFDHVGVVPQEFRDGRGLKLLLQAGGGNVVGKADNRAGYHQHHEYQQYRAKRQIEPKPVK